MENYLILAITTTYQHYPNLQPLLHTKQIGFWYRILFSFISLILSLTRFLDEKKDARKVIIHIERPLTQYPNHSTTTESQAIYSKQNNRTVTHFSFQILIVIPPLAHVLHIVFAWNKEIFIMLHTAFVVYLNTSMYGPKFANVYDALLCPRKQR